MTLDFFRSKEAQKGQPMTRELFIRTTEQGFDMSVMERIAKGEKELKGRLPGVTWQATFGGHRRLNRLAQPNGLFMVDLDHLDMDVKEYYRQLTMSDAWNRVKDHLYVAHITPSRAGLRLVFSFFNVHLSIQENQNYVFNTLSIPEKYIDKGVHDWARFSYLVPRCYFLYLNSDIFDKEINPKPINTKYDDSQETQNTAGAISGTPATVAAPAVDSGEAAAQPAAPAAKAGSDLFGNFQTEYRGISLKTIAEKWMELNGGIPKVGERNNKVYDMCLDLRYICDFNAHVVAAAVPDYSAEGEWLSQEEILTTARSACSANRGRKIPDIIDKIVALLQGTKEADNEEEDEQTDNVFDHLMPQNAVPVVSLLPPIFREYASIAPDDFKSASVMALLPMLGTLGSRLRATYLDGEDQAPSFQVEIEAPMASGKSFARRIYQNVMRKIREKDAIFRAEEDQYLKELRAAINAKKQPEQKTFPIRITAPTTSVSKLLERIKNAQGAHVFSFTDEIRVVIDAMKRGSFGDLRALLRNAFDAAEFGQDYKSDHSTNALVEVMYNTLHCGTPAEYQKLYANNEDGSVSRIIFATLPDQSFKEMPRFKKLTANQLADINKHIDRLNAITMNGDEVQPIHMLKDFEFVNDWASRWIKEKRRLAKKFNDKTLDTFMKRSAVVGFRAAMLAWFLFGKDNKTNRKKTVEFAEYIAEYMVSQLCRRYRVAEVSNTIRFYMVWVKLGDVFTYSDVSKVKDETMVKSERRQIIKVWKKTGLIEKIASDTFKKKI